MSSIFACRQISDLITGNALYRSRRFKRKTGRDGRDSLCTLLIYLNCPVEVRSLFTIDRGCLGDDHLTPHIRYYDSVETEPRSEHNEAQTTSASRHPSVHISPSLPSLSFSFPFFSFIHFRLHSLSQQQDRIVRTPALLCRLEFRSFESSGSRQGTIPLPASAPQPVVFRPSPLPSPILAAPSSSSLADSSDSPSLSLCFPPSLSFSLFLSLSLPLCLVVLRQTLGSFSIAVSLTLLVLSSVFLPSHLAAANRKVLFV